jgi:hypothetical protein
MRHFSIIRRVMAEQRARSICRVGISTEGRMNTRVRVPTALTPLAAVGSSWQQLAAAVGRSLQVFHSSGLQQIAADCSSLQRIAADCSSLQVLKLLAALCRV